MRSTILRELALTTPARPMTVVHWVAWQKADLTLDVYRNEYPIVAIMAYREDEYANASNNKTDDVPPAAAERAVVGGWYFQESDLKFTYLIQTPDCMGPQPVEYLKFDLPDVVVQEFGIYMANAVPDEKSEIDNKITARVMDALRRTLQLESEKRRAIKQQAKTP